MDEVKNQEILETLAKSNVKIGNFVLDNHGSMTLTANMGEAEKQTVEDKFGDKKAILEYVDRLKPIVRTEYQERYDKIWMGILELSEVRKEVFNKGKQQNTTFNRNLVAQIIHVMSDKIFLPTTRLSHIAEHLEPEKGIDHPVRNKLGE